MIKIIAAGLKYAGQFLAVGSTREFPPEIEAQYITTGKATAFDFAQNAVTVTRNPNGDIATMVASDRRVGSICLLHYENEAGFIATPSSEEQVFSNVVMIPAGTIKPGDTLRFIVVSEDAGTADAVLRRVMCRVHSTSDVINGTWIASAGYGSAGNVKIHSDKSAAVVSNTATRSSATIIANGNISATAGLTNAINCLIDQYIGFTVINSNTLVNHNVYFAKLILEQAP